MKNKKPKVALTGIILLFSSYVFYKNITFQISYTPETENIHQRYLKRMPKSLTFAGETVHFNKKEAYAHFYKELYYRTRKNAYTAQALKNAGRFFPMIERNLKAHKLPEDLKYLALAESNLTNAHSPKGAAGFWQFTRATGQELGLVINDEIDERLDPEKSTRAACKHFAKLYALFGDWASVVAAYNVGETALYIAFQRQKVDSYYDLKLNRETTNYLYRIIALKDLVEHTEKYGMKYRRIGLPKASFIPIKEDIPDVKLYCKNLGYSFEQVKALNPWIIGNSIHIEELEKSFFLKTPTRTTPN